MGEEIDLKDLFISLWRKKIPIIVVTIICAILGIIYYETSSSKESLNNSVDDEIYVSSNLFQLGNKESTINSVTEEVDGNGNITQTNSTYYISDEFLTIDEECIGTFLQILKSDIIFQTIMDEFDLDIEKEEWEDLVSIVQIDNTQLMSISFMYTDSELVLNVNNRLTELLVEKIKEVYSSYNFQDVIIYQEAEIVNDDSEIIQTSSTGSVVKAFCIPVIGFVLACAVVIVIECFNGTIKNSKQLEKYTKLKTLAVIPKNEKMEQIKYLKINVSECKILFLTSISKIEERNFVAINLAKSFAKSKKKVLLLDLNNENLELIRKYNNKGIVDFLNSNDKFVEKYANETTIENLSILTLGGNYENTTELLESKKMVESLNTLERLFDVIIVNSGEILTSANSLAVSKISKYAIIVLKNGEDKLENVLNAKRNIEDLGGTVIGTVLSN